MSLIARSKWTTSLAETFTRYAQLPNNPESSTQSTLLQGLAQTGAWGCFDEFNRITVEVLSVIAVQVKSIQDAIKETKKTFDFMGEEIPLSFTVRLKAFKSSL